MNCGKYVYRENDYIRSLKHLLKKEPFLIFKDSNFELVWFYIDENKKINVYTYESENYYLEYFLEKRTFQNILCQLFYTSLSGICNDASHTNH